MFALSFNRIKNFSSRTSLLALGLIALALIFFIIVPAIKSTIAVNQNLQKIVDELEGKKQANESKSVYTTYKKYEPRLQTINKAILYRTRELEFITTLESVADKNGVEQKIQLGELRQQEISRFYSMPVQISLQGGFANTMRYLQGLERLPFYINIHKIGFNSGGTAENAGGIVSMYIAAETYWR